MKWNNVKLILSREVRDQMRDRRTLFVIAVLPVMLYPLLGLTFLQVAQFLRENRASVTLIGAERLPALPPLVSDEQFEESLCASKDDVRLFELQLDALASDADEQVAAARQDVLRGESDVVVYFPADFAIKLDEFRQAAARRDDGARRPVEVPRPEIHFNTAKERSRLAYDRVSAVLSRWRQEIVAQTLVESQVSPAATQPFEVVANDVARASVRRAALWSKVLPFVVIIWALTGAFYPAIDLCAGEKERGTLETLLSSPAQRSEIVMGKLLTIMLFSMVTSLLNLGSMTLTGSAILAQMRDAVSPGAQVAMTAPPWTSVAYLVVALVPIAALFSALALALAAMARSTKEGQYYLMPLLLVTMPLMMLPLLPATELNLGTSLIPVTGIMLLLRAMMEGEVHQTLIYLAPVLTVTLGCCYFAVRWAVHQFNDERVLFRGGERLDLRLWLMHLVRDRGMTPSAAEAVLCAVVLLLIRFFAGPMIPMKETLASVASVILTLQVVFIGFPVVLMAVMLTRSVRSTLLLRWPSARTALDVPVAALLAVMIHPVANVLGHTVVKLYPINDAVAEQIEASLGGVMQQSNVWIILALFALTPAICEELAFRGFILSGLRHVGSKWTAILVSAVLFGVAHSVIQQSITATAVGVVIGYIAVQSRSLWPCMAFHLVHNALGILAGRVTAEMLEQHLVLRVLYQEAGDGFLYNWPVVAVGGALAIVLLIYFRSRPQQLTPEEQRHLAANRATRPFGASC